MLSPTFAAVLQSGRGEFNRRFQEARHLYPELNAEAFARFLQTSVDPLVEAVAAADRGQESATAGAAYDAALELVGQKLAGSGSTSNHIEEGWRTVLIPAAMRVVEAPRRAISSICNALHHLATTPGARPAQWISEMSQLAPACNDLQSLLTAGQITAWRAGLSHYRDSALQAANSLPPALALRATGAPNGEWPQIRERLVADPWFDPSNPSLPGALRVAAQTGSFRGYGGTFSQPPLIAASGNHFLVRCGNETWLMIADAFGATFHRAPSTEFEARAGAGLTKNILIHGNSVKRGNKTLRLPIPGNVSSAAANETTLALTSRLTHSIVLIALT